MIPEFKAGQRVQHRAMLGTEETATVWRVTRHGLWVTMADGTRQQWHPDDVTAAADKPAFRITN